MCTGTIASKAYSKHSLDYKYVTNYMPVFCLLLQVSGNRRDICIIELLV